MTAAEYRKRIKSAELKEKRFRRFRNFWRSKVRSRKIRFKEFKERRKRDKKPHRIGKTEVIRGGTLEERTRYAMHLAVELAHLYYDEYKPWNKFRWAILNRFHKYRSDCSSWAFNLCDCIGIKSPIPGINYNDPMYTGSIVEHCKQVDRHYAETHIGTAVLFGDGTAFHMGLSLAEGERIVQHGQEPVEYGTFDEFGPGTTVRYYKFIT